MPKVLKWATESVDNPDLRDRGYIYWRLLSTDPAAAQGIVLSDKPMISTESEAIDRGVLDRLLLHTGTLASIYGREPQSFVRNVRPKILQDSPALSQEAKESYLESLRLPGMAAAAVAARSFDDSSTSQPSTGTTAAHGPPIVPPKPARQDSDIGGDYGVGAGTSGTGLGGGGAADLLGEDDESDEEEEGTALNPSAVSQQQQQDNMAEEDARSQPLSSQTASQDDAGEALDPYASLARMSLDGWGTSRGGNYGAGDATGYEMDSPQARGNGKHDDLLL